MTAVPEDRIRLTTINERVSLIHSPAMSITFSIATGSNGVCVEHLGRSHFFSIPLGDATLRGAFIWRGVDEDCYRAICAAAYGTRQSDPTVYIRCRHS